MDSGPLPAITHDIVARILPAAEERYGKSSSTRRKMLGLVRSAVKTRVCGVVVVVTYESASENSDDRVVGIHYGLATKLTRSVNTGRAAKFQMGKNRASKLIWLVVFSFFPR